MPARAYYESLWEQLPRGLEPERAVLRERFLLKRLSDLPGSSPRVLDIGCGEGHFAIALRKAGADVLALDVAEEPVRRARELHPDLDTRVVEPEVELPLPDASFAMVWAGEVIEHVTDTAGWLSELRRVLRSGGLLVLSTPDHGFSRRLSLALSRRAFEGHFDPRADHVRFYTRRALGELLEDFGFEDVAVLRVGWPPWRRCLLACGRRSRF